jgi:hypothetical protein
MSLRLERIISAKSWLLSMIYKDEQSNKILEQIKSQVGRMGTITKKLMGLEKYSSRNYMGTTNITDIDYTYGNVPDRSNTEGE